MPDSQIQNYYDISEEILRIQSILDVFVLQDILDPDDAEKMKAKLSTNREVEAFLLKNKIVTRDTINKAYSIIFKLPYIELKNVKIPDEVKTIISEKVAKRFFIIPFDLAENTLKIAVCRPADLLTSYRSGLLKLLAEKHLDLEIFITGETDFLECLKQYSKGKNNQLLLKKASLPVVYLRNQAISEKFYKKIPKDFIVRYRIVVFGENRKGFYLVACEDPNSPVTIKILDFIQRENRIKLERFATSKEDIDHILSLFEKKPQPQSKSSENPKKGGSLNSDVNTTMPESNISENPKVRDKDMLSTLLDTFLGEKGPQLTIDEIPNADLLSKDMFKDEPVPQENNKSVNGLPKEQNFTTVVDDGDTVQDAAVLQEPVMEVENREERSGSAVVTTDEQPENLIPDGIEAERIQSDLGSDSSEDGDLSPAAGTNQESKDLKALSNNNIGALIDSDIMTVEQLRAAANDSFIPKTVAAVIDFALNQRTSDIHVEPEAKMVRIRCRIDGILTDVLRLPIKFHPPFVSRIKIMSKLKIDETRIPQDGRFDIMIKERGVDVRVSTLPTVHGEKIVMRILDKSKGILSLEDLGMSGSAIDKTQAAITEPYGIILVTGPTGSGKSTTLYAVLSRISTPGVNIVTLEDPVEYQMPGVNQCQIKPEIGFTFASGLRSILRQDPNIIMVGEIRDSETAMMATQSALTGHLVLSTLHTNDTAGALPRLINMGIEPFLITSSINLVMAQRLVRRICPRCKEEMKVPQKLLNDLFAEINMISAANEKDRIRIPKEPKLYYGKGCPECNHGYRGRLGIYEVMTISPKIEELAIGKKPADDIKNAAIAEGMITMRQDGILKAFEGQTTIDEVLQAVVS